MKTKSTVNKKALLAIKLAELRNATTIPERNKALGAYYAALAAVGCVLLIVSLSGCVWPGIDNRKQGPFDQRDMHPYEPQIQAPTAATNVPPRLRN